jgi:hypothetical protein
MCKNIFSATHCQLHQTIHNCKEAGNQWVDVPQIHLPENKRYLNGNTLQYLLDPGNTQEINTT